MWTCEERFTMNYLSYIKHSTPNFDFGVWLNIVISYTNYEQSITYVKTKCFEKETFNFLTGIACIE